MAGLPKAGQKTISLAEWKRFTQVADWWDRTHGHKPPAALPPKGGFVGFRFSYNAHALTPSITSSWYTLPLVADGVSPSVWKIPARPGWKVNDTNDAFICMISGWYRVSLLFHTLHHTAKGTRVQILHTPLGGAETPITWTARLHPPFEIDEDDLNNGYLGWGRLADSVWCCDWAHCADGDTIKFQAINYGYYYENGSGIDSTEVWFYEIEFERLCPLL